MSRRKAERIQGHIEHLASAKASGQPVDPDTAAWLGKVDDTLHGRLARAGLVEPRQPIEQPDRPKLGAFLKDYVAKRPDVAGATREIWSQPIRNLCEFFGDGRELADVNEGDAADFKVYLTTTEKLAQTTVAKRLQFVKQFFDMARRRKLIAANPFADVKATAPTTTERQRFIERATVGRILAVCNPTWRLIVTLARYGGLRCPSEVLSLKLAGIDWAAGRVTIESPKGRRAGKGTRVIPLFPELRDELQAAWDRAPEGEVYVVCGPDADRYRAAAQTPSGWRNSNLRTQFERILTRAGVEAWPRLFHNLRASRETELAAEFPIHVVTAWLGNTPAIAMKHYLQVTDADFERAAKSGANSGAHPAHFPAQPVQADTCHNAQNPTQPQGPKALRHIAAHSGLLGHTSKGGGQGIRTLNRLPGT
jgi:integrase